MNSREATVLGEDISELVQAGHLTQAYSLLAPILARHTPFPLLGRIGETVGNEALQPVNDFLEHIATSRTMGGWVVIASALVLQPYLVESARFPGRQPPILALQRRRRPAQVASTAKKQGLGSHHWLTEVVVLVDTEQIIRHLIDTYNERQAERELEQQ